MAEERTGHCLCGAVRFTATLKEPAISACHCVMCRRHLGSAFLGVECAEPLRLEDEGALSLYPSSDWAERGFCATCGTLILWQLRNKTHVTVTAGVLDDQSGLALASEIFIDEKPDYYGFEGERRRLTGPEVVAAFLAGESGDASS